jgi:hypothetical protein
LKKRKRKLLVKVCFLEPATLQSSLESSTKEEGEIIENSEEEPSKEDEHITSGRCRPMSSLIDNDHRNI